MKQMELEFELRESVKSKSKGFRVFIVNGDISFLDQGPPAYLNCVFLRRDQVDEVIDLLECAKEACDKQREKYQRAKEVLNETS